MTATSLAFVFPGQGSQKVGMLAEAHDAFASVRETFAEASDALGYDMWRLIQDGEQDALNMRGRPGLCRRRHPGTPARRVHAERGSRGRGLDGGDHRTR